ncbi:PREDICTED: uncharacterized protein LOC106314514 [Brassica oleracea var. oleracea]|uniref:uncharacterized protein LOC106314514 n=1 Tax=Brassica oleracea var. oleracea TaxID=109376 RepID=UPI0006A6E3E0|nr:PREDICTED: uncharacterized protein LOC106314514 [Brassica oleracea var. oleracea]
MVQSDSVYSGEHDRSNRGSGGDDQNTRRELKALQDKMDLLLSDRAKQEKVNFVGEQKQEETIVVHEVDGLEGQGELCFVNANGTWYKKEPNFQYNNYQQKPFYNNQQGGYKASQNYSQGFSSKGNQSTQGQAGSYTPAPQESSTNAMLKQILESQTRRKSEQHPKEYCNAIHSTSSEIELSDHMKEVDELERLLYGTTVVAKVEAQIVEKVEHKIVERVEIKTVKKVEEKVLQPVRHKAAKPVIGKAVTQLKEVQLEEAHAAEQSLYDKLSFPQRFLTKSQKKVISKFRKDIGDVGVMLSQISNMHDAHVQMILIKDILAHKEEVGELLDISTMQLDPPVTPKFLPKLETQGELLDISSASVNVISIEMVKSLGIENMEPNTSLLMLGDSSSTTPIGLIKEFYLMIGACTIPVDLTVLKMATETRVPLILGTPFLTTVGACIDFGNKKVTLLNVNKAISYPIKSPLMNVDYCGTAICGEPPIEKIKDEVMASEKQILDGKSSHEMCDEHLESAKMEEGGIEDFTSINYNYNINHYSA